jgi:26S proteasome regulatory subunit N10
MPLESVMLCLDNSDWMRNGDYATTRLEAQQAAAEMICRGKTQSNPENTVGVLTNSSQSGGVDLLVSPTEDLMKLLACFSKIRITGKGNFYSAIKIAKLALAHRKNKNGSVRIITFVGSPVVEEVPILQKLGTELKKHNVAIDVISMGDHPHNSEKLMELVNSTNSNDNSHFIVIPPGVTPVDAIIASPIMSGEAVMMGGGGSAGGGFDNFGGVDASMDPELAAVMRASIEEARIAAERQSKQASEESASSSSNSNSNPPPQMFGGFGARSSEDEDAELQAAIALSLQNSMNISDSSSNPPPPGPSESEGMSEEDAALQAALALSLGATTPSAGVTFNNPDFVNSLLAGSSIDPSFASMLLGDAQVDPNDPSFQAAAERLAKEGSLPEPPKKDDKKDPENDKKRKGGDA